MPKFMLIRVVWRMTRRLYVNSYGRLGEAYYKNSKHIILGYRRKQ